MVVSSLHLIGYLSSKAFSMKPTFNWVVSKLQIQVVTFGFQKILSFVFLGSKSVSNGVESVILQSKIG